VNLVDSWPDDYGFGRPKLTPERAEHIRVLVKESFGFELEHRDVVDLGQAAEEAESEYAAGMHTLPASRNVLIDLLRHFKGSS
jgi:hypothetical protein